MARPSPGRPTPGCGCCASNELFNVKRSHLKGTTEIVGYLLPEKKEIGRFTTYQEGMKFLCKHHTLKFVRNEWLLRKESCVERN
jgi:hypothetical protein